MYYHISRKVNKTFLMDTMARSQALPVILTIQPQKVCLFPLLEPKSTSSKSKLLYAIQFQALFLALGLIVIQL